ncbi:kinetochore protein nuf2 [Phaffia rhodozyma]|uniref:Kinetochore protein nuf2 n=1 Tax=Phaffia rhodozyma TaxID=264483 RepID=A0A0F7SPC7_PHARH|nr:kinetochore protein nuf2 [Phaffia rhodozyma]
MAPGHTNAPMASIPPGGGGHNGITYPILRPHEISACLQDLHVQLSEEEITKPTASSIQNAWALLLQTFTGVGFHSFENPRTVLLGMVAYGDLLTEATTFHMFFLHVKRLAKIAGVETFTIQDLTRPEPARVRDSLSGVINFAKFKHTSMDLFEERMIEGERIEERLQMLQNEHQNVEHEIQSVKQRNQADESLVAQAEQRVETINAELTLLAREEKALKQSVFAVTEERKKLKEQHETHQAEITALSNDIEAANSRLVRSPERVRRNILDLAERTNNEKQLLGNYLRKGRELGMKLEVIGSLEQEIRELIDIQKEAESTQRTFHQTQHRLNTLTNDLSRAIVTSNSQTTRLEQLQIQLTNATDKLNRARESWAEKKDRFRQSIGSLREQLKIVLQEKDEDEKALEAKEKEYMILKAESDEYLARNQAEANALINEYWKLRDHVRAYMDEMNTKLGLGLDHS